MAQIEVYGLREHIENHREAISAAILTAIVEVLKLPREKLLHRFFPMDPEDILFPAEKSNRYTVIEVSMFEGRAPEVKRNLILSLFTELESSCGLPQRTWKSRCPIHLGRIGAFAAKWPARWTSLTR